jgi:hypothetical protein
VTAKQRRWILWKLKGLPERVKQHKERLAARRKNWKGERSDLNVKGEK